MRHDMPALIIIDMQKCMADRAAGERNNPDAERNIASLLQAWRSASAAVVHVRHISRSPASMFRPGQPGAEFQEAFMPLAQEHVLEKNVPDAFITSTLERWLRVRGIGSLLFAGVSTNISVESSVRSAGCLGFDTHVLSDATFSFAGADYAGTARSAADVHAMALANLDGEFAAVTTTAAALDRWIR